MELPLRAIIILIIVGLVLVVLSFFITSNASTQIQQGDAERVFNTMCQEYKLNQCPWSATHETRFADFLGACKSIYGEFRDSFSCLYSLCQACKEFEPSKESVMCAAVCETCTASADIGILTDDCCANYAATCSAVTTCGVCARP